MYVRKNSEKCHLKWLFNIIFVDLVENLAGTQGKLPGSSGNIPVGLAKGPLQIFFFAPPFKFFPGDQLVG